MADYFVSGDDLTSVANAIRTKGGTTATLSYPAGFVTAINNLSTSGCKNTTVTSSTNQNAVFKNNAIIATIDDAKLTSIPDYCFSGCSNLTYCQMTKLTTVSAYCFQNCSKLVTIRLPVCTAINGYAFRDCTALKDIYLNNTSKVATIVATAVNNMPSGTKIHVPSSLLSSYKAATNWKNIASQIVAI